MIDHVLPILMKNLHKALQNKVSKDLPSLHFAVGQMLSISGYDLEKTSCGNKNIALKS